LINGATRDEIDFLLGEGGVGQRVELNAMTSDEFVAFVQAKLTEHGAIKVVPDAETLAEAHAAFIHYQWARERLSPELERIAAEPVAPLGNLEARVREWLGVNPAGTWDMAIRALGEEE
jgi:hypothetical protein